jgi:hypothetical protein
MRFTWRITALILLVVVLVVPLAAYASSDGKCPDDPELSEDCDAQAPPFYVVINRSVELLDERPGTGCQPWILNHPEIEDCMSGAPTIDIEAEVCTPMLSERVTSDGFDPVLYEMCCDCGTAEGTWMFRVREWHADGTCPLTAPLDNEGWVDGLPPGTGIELPAPVIVGGLAVLGIALVATGVVVRRRSLKTA